MSSLNSSKQSSPTSAHSLPSYGDFLISDMDSIFPHNTFILLALRSAFAEASSEFVLSFSSLSFLLSELLPSFSSWSPLSCFSIALSSDLLVAAPWSTSTSISSTPLPSELFWSPSSPMSSFSFSSPLSSLRSISFSPPPSSPSSLHTLSTLTIRWSGSISLSFSLSVSLPPLVLESPSSMGLFSPPAVLLDVASELSPLTMTDGIE
mmetsp:Transcript_15812/g.39737  ORF Transcript_15812/g.39737 Transcript_15812/m.39737 type:complete len:207 (-) Transcript_15812:183-803(-)